MLKKTRSWIGITLTPQGCLVSGNLLISQLKWPQFWCMTWVASPEATAHSSLSPNRFSFLLPISHQYCLAYILKGVPVTNTVSTTNGRVLDKALFVPLFFGLSKGSFNPAFKTGLLARVTSPRCSRDWFSVHLWSTGIIRYYSPSPFSDILIKMPQNVTLPKCKQGLASQCYLLANGGQERLPYRTPLWGISYGDPGSSELRFSLFTNRCWQ